MVDRRAFLKRLVQGTAYAAPVIHTLTTPRDLNAIVTSGRMMGIFGVRQGAEPQNLETGPQAPWSVPPEVTSPWSAPPPWADPGSGGDD